jgi:hypothetical protein
MTSSRIRGAVQFLPLMLFGTYAFWHGAPTDDRWLEAFRLGGLAALAHLLSVWRSGRAADRLALGANLYLLVGGLATLAQQWWLLRFYGALQESGIFLFMLGVGAVASFGTTAGFLTVSGAPARRASLVMLAATAAALAVSFVFRGHPQVSTGLPIVVLTLLQRALAARQAPAGLAVAAGPELRSR